MRSIPLLTTPLVATALWLAACSAEPDAPATSAAAGDGGQAAGRIAVQCQTGSELDAEPRSEIESSARQVLQSLRDGDTEALWNRLHPQAQREDQHDAFVEALRAPMQRLRRVPQTEVVQTYFIDVEGGANALAKVQCGAEGEDERLTLLVNAGDEDVAAVVLRSRAPLGVVTDGGFAEVTTTVQLRRRGDQWGLLGVGVTPSSYRGKHAIDYEALANVAMRARKVVVGYLLLGLAKMLSDRGVSVETEIGTRIAGKLEAIERDQLFSAEMGTWTVGDSRFEIDGMSLVATQNDISPVVRYISPQGLVEDLLARDADALVEEVRRRFPELPKHFDAVVFEAYAKRPSPEQGEAETIEAFRIVRYFDPSQRPQ